MSEFSITALDAGREPGRKPAVERDAGDECEKHRRSGGDHREQQDDAHMQPRAGPSAPARRDDLPDFPADQSDQQQRSAQIDEEERDDDPMRRRDRRKAGEHQEGDGRRQQREHDGARAKDARGRPGW